jgi:hypothetical protein
VVRNADRAGVTSPGVAPSSGWDILFVTARRLLYRSVLELAADGSASQSVMILTEAKYEIDGSTLIERVEDGKSGGTRTNRARILLTRDTLSPLPEDGTPAPTFRRVSPPTEPPSIIGTWKSAGRRRPTEAHSMWSFTRRSRWRQGPHPGSRTDGLRPVCGVSRHADSDDSCGLEGRVPSPGIGPFISGFPVQMNMGALRSFLTRRGDRVASRRFARIRNSQLNKLTPDVRADRLDKGSSVSSQGCSHPAEAVTDRTPDRS